MRKVRCADCGRTYDYDDDGFCPRCGAFNQPDTGTGNRRAVVRVDGLSEAGHRDSFLHREFHAEERERHRTGLDQPQHDWQKNVTAELRKAATQMTSSGGRNQKGANPGGIQDLRQIASRKKGGVAKNDEDFSRLWPVLLVLLLAMLRACAG